MTFGVYRAAIQVGGHCCAKIQMVNAFSTKTGKIIKSSDVRISSVQKNLHEHKFSPQTLKKNHTKSPRQFHKKIRAYGNI